MKVDYIIVQAGGKGTRMGYLTYNKPKALIPVDNLPMLFHLFRKFPDKYFFIIGDYKYDVLSKYIHEFAEVDYEMIDARGKKGTLSGIKEALGKIPEGQAFMLTWSDLILAEEYEIPKASDNYVGIAKDFRCRWLYFEGEFREEPSESQGVAGNFIFEDKRILCGIPDEGELVRWLSKQQITFKELPLWNTREYGLLEEYEKLPKEKCRPFNRITVENGCVVKEAIDELGKQLAVREKAWYDKVIEKKIINIPEIYETEPAIKMEKIEGKNIYEYHLSHAEKRHILEQLINCLKNIHELGTVPSEQESYYNAYIGKTFDRLKKVYSLVPFADKEIIKINGAECPNVFYYRDRIEKMVMKYMPDCFCFIHGDCTFSNMLLRNDSVPVMIDPRGYFGYTELYGDAAYDWVKLYYSLAGNYDTFNLKKFRLRIEEDEVFLEIESNGWEDMEEDYFELLEDEVDCKQMKLLHAITWLSLTTYAWQDYDSICGAFYNGLLILREVIDCD